MTTQSIIVCLLLSWPTTPAEWRHERIRLNAGFVACMTDYADGCEFYDRVEDGKIRLDDYAVFQRCIGHLMRCRTIFAK
jgi:hypothetical protein